MSTVVFTPSQQVPGNWWWNRVCDVLLLTEFPLGSFSGEDEWSVSNRGDYSATSDDSSNCEALFTIR